jgi:hypothetical protein
LSLYDLQHGSIAANGLHTSIYTLAAKGGVGMAKQN